jgi:hypothetical protein
LLKTIIAVSQMRFHRLANRALEVMANVTRDFRFIRAPPAATEDLVSLTVQHLLEIFVVHYFESGSFDNFHGHSRNFSVEFRRASFQIFTQARQYVFELTVCALGISQIEKFCDLLER